MLSDIRLFWIILYAFLVCGTRLSKGGGKKEIRDVRLDFLATAEKGATPRCSKKQIDPRPRACTFSATPLNHPFRQVFSPLRVPNPVAAQPLLATLFFYRYPRCRYFKGDVSRMRPLVWTEDCVTFRGQAMTTMRCQGNRKRAKCIRVNYKMSFVQVSQRDDSVKRRLRHSRWSDVNTSFRAIDAWSRSRVFYI